MLCKVYYLFSSLFSSSSFSTSSCSCFHSVSVSTPVSVPVPLVRLRTGQENYSVIPGCLHLSSLQCLASGRHPVETGQLHTYSKLSISPLIKGDQGQFDQGPQEPFQETVVKMFVLKKKKSSVFRLAVFSSTYWDLFSSG